MENQFLENEQIQPWIWFRYIDDIFFIGTASEKELLEKKLVQEKGLSGGYG